MGIKQEPRRGLGARTPVRLRAKSPKSPGPTKIRSTSHATNPAIARTAEQHGKPTSGTTEAVKINVDFDRCQSNGLCMSAAPELFEVRDDGYLSVLIEAPGEDQRAAALDAVRLCPTQAISLEG